MNRAFIQILTGGLKINMHWRERELLGVVKKGKQTTTEIVSRVNMSKVTALKYLESLKEKNLVDYQEIGPAKVWFLKPQEGEIEKKVKVLVADDDKNVINIIRDSLAAELFEVLEAVNGKEALGMVFAESPDILILDIMMPDMDGYKVCEELKKHEHTKNMPIIILSAKVSVEDKLRAMEMGIDDYIVKPFDPRELKARIKMRMRQNNSNHA
ncbi:MAG: response regulator [Candidatus Methanoperedens sp.]|nr:response regulator [Candidatus Methanoperedens sp.]MCZ7394426.1 response regulator [Candidatus Methanoperedens sp.]